MTQHNAHVWLVNTGWSGGSYGVGKRMKLGYTRAHLIDAIHAGALTNAPVLRDPFFGFEVVTACPHVPSEILVPRRTWEDGAAYDTMARKLAGLFRENFKHYESGVSDEVKAAGPQRG